MTPRKCWRSCSEAGAHGRRRPRWAIRSCSITASTTVPASEVAKQFGEHVRGDAGHAVARSMAGADRVRLRRAPGAGHARARTAVCPRWRTCGMPCVGSGRTPGELEGNANFYRGAAQAVHGDASSACDAGRGAEEAGRGEVKTAILLVTLLVVAPRPAALGARGAPRVSRTAPDRAGNLRRAVEGAGARRQSAPRALRGTAGGLHEAHGRRGRRWSTTPTPSAGPRRARAD